MRSRASDVLVVGGGPAGASAAIYLARAGRSVVLLDRSSFPRDKACGEGILPPGVEVLEELGVAEALLRRGAHRFSGIRYHAPGGRSAIGAFPRGSSGMAVRRLELDQALVAAARAQGVTVREGIRVTGLLTDERGAVAGVSLQGGETLSAPLTIAADGSHSLLRRLAGLEVGKTSRRGFRMHLRPTRPPTLDPFVDVYLGRGLETYVTPVGPGDFLVALLTDSPDLGLSERTLRDSLAGRGGVAQALSGAPAASEPLAASGMGATARRSLKDGLLLHGDAAGSPDPVAGMGIAFALACSRGLPVALREAFRAGDFSARALSPWERVRRRQTSRGFAMTRALLWLAGSDWRTELAVGALARAPGLFPTLFRFAVPAAP